MSNILLVEDDGVLRHIIAENLCTRGYGVMTAVDGHDAYAQFVTTPRLFDVVVTDYHMPGMYGDKLRERIYAHCDEIGIPRPVVCIMSGAWGGGVNDGGFIAKPFDTDVLVGTIEMLLAARRAA